MTLVPTTNNINLNDGFAAEVYRDSSGNIIVSFEGTQPGIPGLNSAYSNGTLSADQQLEHGQTPQAVTDAQNSYLQ
jgi:hypothetical protein